MEVELSDGTGRISMITKEPIDQGFSGKQELLGLAFLSLQGLSLGVKFALGHIYVQLSQRVREARRVPNTSPGTNSITILNKKLVVEKVVAVD